MSQGKKHNRESLNQFICPEPNTGCWLWSGFIDKDGYGCVKYHAKRQRAARLLYQLDRGPIPLGLQIDHLCRQRLCVNPWHLEPVTCKENINRGETGSVAGQQSHNRSLTRTHCRRGHPYNGSRHLCRVCTKVNLDRYRRKLKERT